jgi:hypothetical protein
VASSLVFFTVLVQPALSQNQPQYHPLELRSAKWFKIKINDLPSEYGPIEKKWLRQGAYQIVIKNSKKTIRKNLAFPQAWQKWKANKKSLF